MVLQLRPCAASADAVPAASIRAGAPVPTGGAIPVAGPMAGRMRNVTPVPRPVLSLILTLALMLALTLALMLAQALPGRAQSQTETGAQEPVVRPVKLMRIADQATPVTRQFFGQVVARQTVDLAFQVGGQIVLLPVIEGQELARGTLIAQLDLEPFALQLNQAKLQLDQAQRTLDRLDQLQGTVVSKVSADDARTQLGLAQITARNAEYSLNQATLHAPFDALVAVRYVDNFSTVAAGTQIVRLHDMSDLRIDIDVPEVLFQRAGEKSDVELLARFPLGDTLYPLTIREFDAEASATGQTFRLTLGMDRPEGLNVLPGSSVTVLARIPADTDQPRVPATALRIANDGSVGVMVFRETDPAKGQGTVSLRPVTVAPDRDGALRVQDGLAPGEEIVMTGASALTDGQTVRRFTGFAN